VKYRAPQAAYVRQRPKYILSEREDVDADQKDKCSQTRAARKGHEAVVRILIERADVDAGSKDKDDWTPLSWAAGEGYEAIVRLLIGRKGVDADLKDTKHRTLLSWGAGEGHEAVVRLLVELEGVDADSKDKKHRTPLSWATGRAVWLGSLCSHMPGLACIQAGLTTPSVMHPGYPLNGTVYPCGYMLLG